jgi:hypothetical protein
MRWPALGALLLVACSGAPPDSGGADYELTSAPSPAPAATQDTESEKEPAPSKPPIVSQPVTSAPNEEPLVLAGTLAQSPKVAFGGKDYCKYEMILEDISVELSVLWSTDTVVAARVTNRTHESARDCTYAPMAPTLQGFALREAGRDKDNNILLSFDGAAENKPPTNLGGKLQRVGSGYELTLYWRRQAKAPLDWYVVAKVPIAQK